MLDLAVLGQVSETSLTRDMAFKHGGRPGCPTPLYRGETCCFLTLGRPHWRTGVGWR
jgi:hypothetical protein